MTAITLAAARIDSCEVVEVIRVTYPRGAGRDASDPVRTITRFYTLKGELLFELDPYAADEEPI